MNTLHVHLADFIGKNGVFFDEVRKHGGEFKKVQLENGRDGQVCCSFIFPDAEAGFVFKMGSRKLADWEKDFMNQLVWDDLPGFVIRYWRDSGSFSLAEYGFGEGAPFKNGDLGAIIGWVKDYLV